MGQESDFGDFAIIAKDFLQVFVRDVAGHLFHMNRLVFGNSDDICKHK